MTREQEQSVIQISGVKKVYTMGTNKVFALRGEDRIALESRYTEDLHLENVRSWIAAFTAALCSATIWSASSGVSTLATNLLRKSSPSRMS